MNMNQDRAYSGAQRMRIIMNIFKHLKQIKKARIWVEKRVKLVKFRSFVVPQDLYYWNYH